MDEENCSVRREREGETGWRKKERVEDVQSVGEGVTNMSKGHSGMQKYRKRPLVV